MKRIEIPSHNSAELWRRHARGLLVQGYRPEQLSWAREGDPLELFETPEAVSEGAHRDAPSQSELRVPREFVQMAENVCWHRDSDRYARLYAALYRLHRGTLHMDDRSDPELVHLRAMQKSVQRAMHKMKAFVRFRDIGLAASGRRVFAAWFEPPHPVVEPTAPFFARRFADMDWHILSPDASARYENGVLSVGPGVAKPEMPDDAAEALWLTYFRNIFNPARLKVSAMESEMPRQYWRNLPEAAAIPELIARAPQRAREMAARAPSVPPARVIAAKQQFARFRSDWDSQSSPDTALSLQACRRCALHAMATQVVPGCGPADAALMLVGEQPGDQEDLAGVPFVGPAGEVLNQALERAGIPREAVYLTNAVKHFKFKADGRRRLHQRPDHVEIERCRWWLDQERRRVKPSVIAALGATAAHALTGEGSGLSARRGRFETQPDGTIVLITWHPSFVLRERHRQAGSKRLAELSDDLLRAHQRATTSS